MTVGDTKEKSKDATVSGGKDKVAVKKELSEEDKQLCSSLDMLVERIADEMEDVRMTALQALRDLIRSSTSSISSIPKALKYLLPHYQKLKAAQAAMPSNQPSSLRLAHILAVLAMSYEDESDPAQGVAAQRDALKYQLIAAPLNEPIDAWGHEFARHLAKEVGEEFTARGGVLGTDIATVTEQLVAFFLRHNAEPDACDLLIEVDKVEALVEAVSKAEADLANSVAMGEGQGLESVIDYERVCRYLTSCVPFEPFPADHRILKVVFAIYLAQDNLPWALITALRLNSPDLIRAVFAATTESAVMRRQLAFMLARQRTAIAGVGRTGAEEEALQEVMFNSKLSQHYLDLARELQILSPRDPEDIFDKGGAATARDSGKVDPLRVLPSIESAKSNLATTLVNAFVNAGYCQDLLVMPVPPAASAGASETSSADAKPQVNEQYLWKHKDQNLLTAAASLGAVNMWNLGEGLGTLDALYHQHHGSANPQAPWLQAGALLGIGLLHSGIRNEADPAFALLREPLESSQDLTIRTGAILGLAFAYAGTGRRDVVSESLLPLISDQDLQTSALATLAVGNIFVGSADGDASSAILQAMMEREAVDLDQPMARFYSLGLGLLFCGQPEAADAVLDTLAAIEQHPIGRDTQVLVKGLAYAGSGNINRIHELLGVIQQHNLERKQRDDKAKAEERAKAENRSTSVATSDDATLAASKGFESNAPVYAVIGMALVAASEEVGQEMALRMFSHVMHYGDVPTRAAVPLAIGLLYASHPTLPVMDSLSKYSHDPDKSIAINAIVAMGMTGAGTNHAKMAQLLRQLSGFYVGNVECLQAVRVAQGLVHMGKGTLSMSPIRMHRQLVSPTGLAALLSATMGLTCGSVQLALDRKSGEGVAMQSFLLAAHPYLLYFFLAGASPRFLVCLDAASPGEEDKAVAVPVRVGQAVDTVAQAGRPRTITGFQTHSTPVVIGYGEQAELATDEWAPVSPVLEGFVLVNRSAHAN